MQGSDKAALRREVRLAYGGEEARRRESDALCAHLTAWDQFREADVVAGYLPLPREADVTPALLSVLSSGRTLALPRIGARPEMTMRRVRELSELVCGPMGLMEPPEDAEILPPESLSLVIVPLEALDQRGMRLGKGAGYYDAYLRRTVCMTVGAVMSWQWRETVPAGTWDVPLWAAADAVGIHLFEDAMRKERTAR